MLEPAPPCQGFGGAGQCGAPGAPVLRADVEGAGFVEPGAGGEQGVPVDRAEKGPDGHRADVCAFRPHSDGGVPHFAQPAQLFVARGAEMGLRHRDGEMIARPDLAQPRRRAGVGVGQMNAHGLDVRIGLEGVSAP